MLPVDKANLLHAEFACRVNSCRVPSSSFVPGRVFPPRTPRSSQYTRRQRSNSGCPGSPHTSGQTRWHRLGWRSLEWNKYIQRSNSALSRRLIAGRWRCWRLLVWHRQHCLLIEDRQFCGSRKIKVFAARVSTYNWSNQILLYPLNNEVVGGYIVFTPSVRLSVRPSVRPSRLPCPLCNIYSSGWILSILATNDHYHERVCRTQWPLTLTYIFKVIRPWLWKSCPLCNIFSSRSIISIFATNNHYH